MTAPSIRVNGGTAGVKAAVSASAAVTATLDSTAGVRSCVWSVISTDETTSTASYTLVQSGSVGQNVAFTSLTAGTAMLLKVVINGGINLQTGLADADETTATVKVGVLTSAGYWVGVAGEEMEHDSTFGSTEIINAGIRLASTLSPSGIAVHIVKAATAAALPANTRSGNVLTANANGAFAAVDGATVNVGEYFIAQNEGGGASHVNNGVYSLTTAGDGSNPWTATRATYFNESGELIQGTRFTVQSGTTYGGKERKLATSGATINVTALEFDAFAYAPNDVAYLTIGASSLLSNETNISAVTSTVDFASTTVTPLSVSRTDAATTTSVDAFKVVALSAGSAAAGFGVSCLYQGEFGGAAENYGRLGFTATDVTGATEDTKCVIQTRTAGAALATCAEFSGTAITLAALAGGGTQAVQVDNSGVISGAGYAAASTATTITAGAGLTGGGDLSANRTITVAAADASITVNADSIEASGSFVAKNISTTGTLASGAITTSAALTVALDDGTPTNISPVLTLRHTYSGGNGGNGIGTLIILQAEDDAGNVEETGFITSILTNAANGAEASKFAIWTRTGGGALAENAILDGAGVFTVTGGFVGPSLDHASAGALLIGATAGSVAICDQLTITNTGARTHTLDATAVDTEQWGTAGVNYIARAADAQTTTDATATNVWTFAMADNSAVKFEVHVYAYIVGAAAQRAYFGRRAGYNRDGGAPTEDFDEVIHTDKVVGGWGAGPTVTLVAGAPGANDVSVQVTGVAATNVRWITQVEYRVTTTSA
jgi:hypothetical protein